MGDEGCGVTGGVALLFGSVAGRAFGCAACEGGATGFVGRCGEPVAPPERCAGAAAGGGLARRICPGPFGLSGKSLGNFSNPAGRRAADTSGVSAGGSLVPPEIMSPISSIEGNPNGSNTPSSAASGGVDGPVAGTPIEGGGTETGGPSLAERSSVGSLGPTVTGTFGSLPSSSRSGNPKSPMSGVAGSAPPPAGTTPGRVTEGEPIVGADGFAGVGGCLGFADFAGRTVSTCRVRLRGAARSIEAASAGADFAAGAAGLASGPVPFSGVDAGGVSFSGVAFWGVTASPFFGAAAFCAAWLAMFSSALRACSS